MASRPHRFELRLLGPCVVEVDSRALDLTQWPAKAASLLRLLAVVREHRMSREEAVELLWPEVAPDAGVSNLKGVVHRLRRALGTEIPSPIVLEHGWVQLNLACQFEIDADRIQELVEAAGEDVELLEEAAGLYRGEPLPEDRYENWAIPAREHLQRRWRELTLRLGALYERRGDRERALHWARRLVEEDPLGEEAVQALIRLSIALGRRTEARRTFQALEQRLRAELGVGPSAETRALIAPPGNLPAPASSFVGRKRELAELGELLRRQDVRLVTLTGPGGVGKTRLALQAMRERPEPFGDGIFLVSLAGLRDPTLVAAAIARVLGVREEGMRPIAETLAAAIGQKEMLLILDNFEHLLSGAPAISGLLAACSHLTVLATSRVLLHLTGEHMYPVSPLALPDAGAETDVRSLARSDAVALFVQRVRAVRPDLALTGDTVRTAAEICGRLEGLPLAIELAASRVRVLSPSTLRSQLTSRLAVLTEGPRDAPERQRTLRDTIAWSYRLLDPPRQRLFCRLSVFAGGWTTEAALAVCDLDGDLEIEMPAGLEGLVHSNLLTWDDAADGPRYGMLETIREWAAEQLKLSGETERIRRRHASYFLQLAERAEPELWGPKQAEWLERLERDHDNLRVALAWCMEGEEPERIEQGLRLASALLRFWAGHGHVSEGRGWLERGLQRGGDVVPAVRAEASGIAGWLARMAGDDVGAARLLHQALELHRELGDIRNAAIALDTLGDLYLFAGDPRTARPFHEEALALRRQLGDKRHLAMSLNSVGLVELEAGNLERAEALFDEALDLARESGDTRGTALILTGIGQLKLEQGDIDRARARILESLALHEQLQTKLDVALCVFQLGCVAALDGQAEKTARLVGAAQRGLHEVAGPSVDLPRSARYDRCLSMARGQLGDMGWQEAWEEGERMTLEEAVREVRDETRQKAGLGRYTAAAATHGQSRGATSRGEG